ncbi:DUF92 domain-containing protein [Paenibacillaceae bacterium]|nr:DUF92 domain-containing protein [Paenibacillaceae bacterium]
MLIGLIGSSVIAFWAYRRSSLSSSGAWSAVIMGTAYVALGGLVWFGTLLVFFISSTFWSKWKRRSQAKRSAEAKYAKTGRRDAVQVWANGGLGLLLCAGYALRPDPAWLFAFAGVMAAVNADTWATELGALSRSAPRALLGGKPVPPGTSGGVTVLGSLAALAGAALIGAAAAVLGAVAPIASPAVSSGAAASASSEGAAAMGSSSAAASAGSDSVVAAANYAATLDWSIAAALAVIAAIAGLAGCFADSLLGAAVQAQYRCRVCGSDTERAVHCGQAAQLASGRRWMTNDAVNLLSSVFAGGVAWALAAWLVL